MPTRLSRSSAILWLTGSLCIVGCEMTVPSARLNADVSLPVPKAPLTVPAPGRFFGSEDDLPRRLSARSLIPVAFHSQPDIKSSFHRFKSEAARYDFFYTSRDSLTPRLQMANSFAATREPGITERTRQHSVTLGVEKRFFDTTELNVAAGFDADAVDEALGNQPFVSANLRYPLWVSRQKLERTSEEIFRRNELNDAQLAYIQTVRSRLQDTLFRFYQVMDQERQLEFLRRWLADLESLRARLGEWKRPTEASDRGRLEAEIARATAEVRKLGGRHEIDVERFKAAAGIPFYVQVELADEAFNPFAGAAHAELFTLSVETDPEIATLRNAARNAEVQLDLARRGRWDVSFLVDGRSGLDGGGERDGETDWSVSAGFEISAVDERVTGSLIRQSQSNIARFMQAIAERENQIFVDTLEPLVRIETLGKSRDELIENLPRFQDDYESGMAAYQAGRLNIDDLLKRREILLQQEQEISDLRFLVGANVAELCAATGKFFELISGQEPGAPADDAG